MEERSGSDAEGVPGATYQVWDKEWGVMVHNNFDLDLRLGKEGEDHIFKVIKTAEVKTDYRVGETGNVFVEEESRGKPSGIKTTKAEYWNFLLEGEFYSKDVFIGIKTERLNQNLTNFRAINKYSIMR